MTFALLASIANSSFIQIGNKGNTIFAKDLLNDCKRRVAETTMPPGRRRLDSTKRPFIL